MSTLEGLREGMVDLAGVPAAVAEPEAETEPEPEAAPEAAPVVGGTGLSVGRFDGCVRSARLPVLGTSSLLENILVNRVFKDFSACFG